MKSFSSTDRSSSNFLPSRPSLSRTSYNTGLNWSSNDIGYNGSEGFIGDSSLDPDQERYSIDDFALSTPSKAAAPSRPAIGARLLSTLSNAQPAATTLTRSGSKLHSRAKSLAQYVPKLNTTASSTGERTQGANKLFADYFHGESAPIRIGAPLSPTKEKEEEELVMDYQTSFTERPTSELRRKSVTQNRPAPVATKSSWFGRKSTTAAPVIQPTPVQDEFLVMNIDKSLFPHGPADPLSPHAFNDLLLNATSLLERMQSAYKEKVEYIANIRPEIDAQREEVEEAQTRSRHLKMQLEDMGRKAQEQESSMQDMAAKLDAERRKTKEASTVKLLRIETDGSNDTDPNDVPRRRKRGSAGSASDSGFESDADCESLLSGGTLSPPAISLTPTPEYDGESWSYSPPRRTDVIPRKMVPNSALGNRYHSERHLGSGGAAWTNADALRSENQELRKQLDAMQTTLQGCIDLVGGMNLG